MCGKQRPQGGGPLGVAELVGVKKVRELSFFSVALRICEEKPGIEYGDLRVALDRGEVELVDLPDLVAWPPLAGGAGEGVAEDDRHLRIVLFQRRDDELEVAGYHSRRSLLFEVIGSDENHHAAGLEGEDISF